MKWKIGNITIKNQVVLAPMAGVSNPSYMKICEEMGLGYAITELISSEAIVRNNKKTFEMLNGIEELKIPVAVQLFGGNPKVMAEAAKIIVEKYNIKIIDINMGCPVPKVAVRSQAGSGLLKDLDRIYEIVSTVSSSVDAFVTVKIRSGWDSNNINAIEVAKIIEKAGAKAITVHPRTKSQGYSGTADWNIIKEVKQNVTIPVIGNGDIKSPELAKKMLEETGCDAIMIGRALLGNPWLIRNTINYFENKPEENVSVEEKIDVCIKHLLLLKKNRGERTACLEIRNHLNWYFKGIKSFSKIRTKLYQTTNIHDIISILNEVKENKIWLEKKN